ncbi:MAG: LPS export ABC transporter permease LptG [Betaproteobacteria bacterium TMED156]|nr:MAG: LPS export ABC transporter permease LptG [Betaproteobacteria bacterium TMED156]
MNLATKYLAKVVLIRIIITLVGFTLLFTFFNFISELDQIGKGAFLISSILIIVLLKIPNVIYEIIPIATLIGSLWAFSELASNSEFTAFRVGGLSPQKVSLIIFLIGLPIAFFTVFLSEIFIPLSDKFSRDWDKTNFKIKSTSNFRSGFWLRDRFDFNNNDKKNVGERIVNIKKIFPDKSLIGVKIYEFDQNSKLISVISANKGNYIKSKKDVKSEIDKKNDLVLNSWKLMEPKVLTISQKGTTQLTNHSVLSIYTKLSERTIEALTIKPEKMSATELYSFIEYLSFGKQKTNRYEIAFWKKVFYPFLLWIMILIAIPAAYIHTRKGSVGYKVFLGMVIGITFHLGNSLFSHLGLLNTWPPVIVAFIPCFLALIFGITIFLWAQKNNI